MFGFQIDQNKQEGPACHTFFYFFSNPKIIPRFPTQQRLPKLYLEPTHDIAPKERKITLPQWSPLLTMKEKVIHDLLTLQHGKGNIY